LIKIYNPDFGEGYTDKHRPRLFVYRIGADSSESIDIPVEGVAQPFFIDETTIGFLGVDATFIKYGVRYCTNRALKKLI
jgi:hypothetical protein